jgi:hypothetical protein
MSAQRAVALSGHFTIAVRFGKSFMLLLCFISDSGGHGPA